RGPHYVLAMHITDSIFRKQSIAGRVRRFTCSGGIAWIPVQLEVGRLHCSQGPGGFTTRGRVASVFVFEEQRCAPPSSNRCRLFELFVNCVPIRLLIIETPEIEYADAINIKSPCKLECAL